MVSGQIHEPLITGCRPLLLQLWTSFCKRLSVGLLLGGFYAVMVLGFSVIWGVMGVINLAHGEFLMIGAYIAWGLFRFFGLDPFASLALILPLMFVVGYLL